MRSFRMTTRGLMIVVALVAISIGGAFQALDSNERLKREIWARDRLAASIDNAIKRPRTPSRSEYRPPGLVNSRRAYYAKIQPTYTRLVWRPWKELPPDTYFLRIYRAYLDEREPALYSGSFEHRYRQWSLRWAAVAGIAMFAIAATGFGIARRFLRLPPPINVEPTPFLTASPLWLDRVPSSDHPGKKPWTIE